MRKFIVLLAVVAVVGVTGATAAYAVPSPPVLCGPTCDPGGGFTGCSSVTGSHSANVGVAWIRHYLVVNYCKVGGIITSVSIAAHGCDVGGVIRCDTGPAWQTGGGVGSTSASFEGHAGWSVFPYIISNNDVVTVSVPAG